MSTVLASNGWEVGYPMVVTALYNENGNNLYNSIFGSQTIVQGKKVRPKETPTNSTSLDRAKYTQSSSTINTFWLVRAWEKEARKADTKAAKKGAQTVTRNLLRNWQHLLALKPCISLDSNTRKGY